MTRIIVITAIIVLLTGPALAAEPVTITGCTNTPVVAPASLTAEQARAVQDAIRQLPPGAKIEVVIENVHGGRATSSDSGTGTGAGARLSGTELKDKLDTSAPGVQLGSGYSATGGSARSSMSAMGMFTPSTAGNTTLLLIGIAMIVGAAAAGYFWSLKAAIILGVVGVGLIAASFYPALLLWVFIGGILLLAADYLIANRAAASAKTTTSALTGIVAAIDSPGVSPEAAAQVKAAISGQPNSAEIKAVVSPIKAKTATVSQPKTSIPAEMRAWMARMEATFRPAAAPAPQPVAAVPAQNAMVTP